MSSLICSVGFHTSSQVSSLQGEGDEERREVPLCYGTGFSDGAFHSVYCIFDRRILQSVPVFQILGRDRDE